MPKLLNVAPGQTYGRLTVVELARSAKNGKWWRCRCECGNICEVTGNRLASEHTRSCGCLRRETSAAIGKAQRLGATPMTEHPLHGTWKAMKDRCNNPNSKDYPGYGGRGIKVCPEWNQSFWSFVRDVGERPDGKSLERVNNDGDYCPENCSWATAEEQMANRRTVRQMQERINQLEAELASLRGENQS